MVECCLFCKSVRVRGSQIGCYYQSIWRGWIPMGQAETVAYCQTGPKGWDPDVRYEQDNIPRCPQCGKPIEIIPEYRGLTLILLTKQTCEHKVKVELR